MYSQDRDSGEYGGSLLGAWNMTRKDWRKLRRLQAMYAPHELRGCLPTVWHWPHSPEFSKSVHLHKTQHTIGFSAMPSNRRLGQWPYPHPTAVSSENDRPFQERVDSSYAGTGNSTEWQRAALQQLLCLKCKMWKCLEEVPASITVCKYCLWRRASPVSHSSLP